MATVGVSLVCASCLSPKGPPSGRLLDGLPDLKPPVASAAAAQPAQAAQTTQAEGFVTPGTGPMLNQNATASRGPGGFTVNLRDAAIDEAARTILGDLLSETFVVDPAVQGRISMNSAEPLSREQLLSLFETALAQNGVRLVREGATYRVTNAASNNQALTFLNPGEAGYGITAIPLRYVGADSMRTLLEGMLTRTGSFKVDVGRNMVFITGSAADRGAAAQALTTLDVDWMAAMSVGLFPLQNVDPATIISELNTTMQIGPGGTTGAAVRLQPVNRLNAVLAVASSPQLLARVQDFIARLDVSANAANTMRAYFLDNGKAEETANLLNALLGNPVSALATSPTGPGVQATTGATRPSQITTPAAPSANERGPRVIADPLNNALLVLADAEGHKLIQRALTEIDRAPAQVLVDATIAEVTLTDQLQFGVQFFFRSRGIATIGNDAEGGLSSGSTAALRGLYPGFNYLVGSGDLTRLALSALSDLTDVRVRSSPSVVVMDNQSATLRVGDQVPIVTRQVTGVETGSAPVVNQIEFRDTGVILTVTPRVSSTGVVTLEIDQEVSSVSSTAASGTLTPTISQRRISSTVAVRSNQTLVLAGLIDDSRSNTRSGVPGFSKIPVLGSLFGSTNKVASRTELVVFLTPRVLRSADDIYRASEEIRSRMNVIAKETQANRSAPLVAAPPATVVQ
jgi:general secretion pathway protein D